MINKSKAIPRQLSSVNRMSGYSRVIQGLISKLMIHTARCKVPGSSNWLDAPKAGWLLAHSPQQESKASGTSHRRKATFMCGEQRAASHAQCQRRERLGFLRFAKPLALLQRTEKGCDRTKTWKGQRNFPGYFVLGWCGVGDGDGVLIL